MASCVFWMVLCLLFRLGLHLVLLFLRVQLHVVIVWVVLLLPASMDFRILWVLMNRRLCLDQWLMVLCVVGVAADLAFLGVVPLNRRDLALLCVLVCLLPWFLPMLAVDTLDASVLDELLQMGLFSQVRRETVERYIKESAMFLVLRRLVCPLVPCLLLLL